MREKELRRLQKSWKVAASSSDLGLWWLAEDVREVVGGNASEETVRRLTLAALEPLLVTGELRAVTLETGGSFVAWDGTIDEQLRKIEEGWIEVGKPTIGDVVWRQVRRRTWSSNPG